MDRVKAGQTIKADDINQLVDNWNFPTIQQNHGVIDQNGKWNQQTPIDGRKLPNPMVIEIDGIKRYNTSGIAYASGYFELIQSGLIPAESRDGCENCELNYTNGILDKNFIVREICDNPTASLANEIACQIPTINTGNVFYAYKATASVAPLKILSGDNGQFRAAWQKQDSTNYNFQNIDGITDLESGNITVGNITEFEREYSKDYSVMASGLSGDLSGGFYTWAERIADDWFIRVRPVPNVSGMEVYDIETSKQIVVAANGEYQVWQSNSGDANNYSYNYDWPRLCDV